MKTFSARLLLALLLAGAGAGCAQKPPAPVHGLKVVTGLPPQGWLVKRLTGGRGEVYVLLKGGQDPHLYEPTVRQVQEMAGAHLLISLGMPFEQAMAQRLKKANPRLKHVDAGKPIRNLKMATFNSIAGIKEEHDEAHGNGELDPHVWMSPILMRQMARSITASLAASDPAGKAVYEKNLKSVETELKELEEVLRLRLASIQGKAVMTFHPAFGYLARDFGFRQIPLEVEGREPSPRQLADLIDLARKEKVKWVLVQPAFSQAAAKVVADAAGAELMSINELAEDYPGMMMHLAEQLGGEKEGDA